MKTLILLATESIKKKRPKEAKEAVNPEKQADGEAGQNTVLGKT